MLKVSPSFLEQYIGGRARRQRDGRRQPEARRRDSRVYYAEPGINQNYHVDGLPLGTRGGMLVEHLFPADGDYSSTSAGSRGARYVEGLEYRHTLIVTIDGEKVFEDDDRRPEDVESGRSAPSRRPSPRSTAASRTSACR